MVLWFMFVFINRRLAKVSEGYAATIFREDGEAYLYEMSVITLETLHFCNSGYGIKT